MTLRQLRVLRFLESCRYRAVTPAMIERQLGMPSDTARYTVDRLHQDRLVDRYRDETNDRRARFVRITDDGIDALNAARQSLGAVTR